jgi:hypothetical protein
MKKSAALFIFTVALLFALPAPRAGAVAPPAGPFFLCVNTTAKPPLPNARVVTSMSACLPFEFLVDLSEAMDTFCWQFANPDGSNPFPTDSIKVTKESHEDSLSGTWVICINGTGPTCSGGHFQIVPMVGTYKTDLQSNARLMLDGRVWDTALGNPFIYECTIADTQDPATKDSVGCTPGSPTTCTGTAGSVYAYCSDSTGSDYFPPNNPFTDPIYLVSVPCAGLRNP